ncbi:MAG TPA: amidohydrolase family protein [Peptococcaceae bacterium]|nr:amidohydrolase family protein [Peptococcaceae bacterium]
MSNLLIYAETILFGKELTVKKDHCLIISDGKIKEILPKRDGLAKIQPGWEVIDLGKVTLMPGMIESHNHLALDARLHGHLEMMDSEPSKLTILALNSLKDDLLSGVTTARCMGDRHYIDTTLKEEIANGRVIGPNLIVSGIGMRGRHGHGFVGIPHSGVEEIRKTCRENLFRGCDHLKVFITGGAPPENSTHIPYYLSFEEIKTVVDEGAQLGVTVSSHCIGGQGLKVAVAAGVHAFDHLYCASDEEIELLIKNDKWAVLTSGVFLDPAREEFCPPKKVAAVRRCREQVRERMKTLIKSGIKYALGTDGNHTFLYKEVVYARELGASAVDALKGVTVRAAELCGISHKTGYIHDNMDADIIAVKGNPLEDANTLKNVCFVMKNGVIYKRF